MSNANYDTHSVSVNTSSSGDNTVVPGIAGKVIYLIGLSVIVGGSSTLTFKDGTTNSTQFGPFVFPGAGSFTLEDAPGVNQAYMRTSIGNSLVINSGSSVAISGTVRYRTA